MLVTLMGVGAEYEHVGVVFSSLLLFSEFPKLSIMRMHYSFGKRFGEI